MPLAANLTGQLMTEAPTARYWRDHLRNTVQFAEGMARVAEAAADDDHRNRPDGEPAWAWAGGACRNWRRPGCRRCDKGRTIGRRSPRSVGEYYVRGGQIDWRGWDRAVAAAAVAAAELSVSNGRGIGSRSIASLRRSFGGDGERAGGSAASRAAASAVGHAALDGLDEHAVRSRGSAPARRRIWSITRCKARR